MCRCCFFTVCALVLFSLTSDLQAQSSELEWVKVNKKRAVVLRGCELFDNVESVTIGKAGKTISLPAALKRRPYKVRRTYRFFACQKNDQGETKLYAKAVQAAKAKVLPLTLKNFPARTTKPVGNCQRFPGGFIYKTIGSSHFSDVRRNTIGLILRYGSPGPYPSCLNVKDRDGNVVAKLGLYARGSGWAARYYAGIGCGSRTPLNGSAVATRARKNTGSSLITFDFGNRCYGPIEANRCIGSSQC